jgi:hypothetical protein
MSQTDDRRDRTLPVTAEVGSEGGSYADPTSQVTTFEGDIERSSGHGGTSSIANYATRTDAEGSAAGHTEGGMVRYPTEPPSPASATEGYRAGASQWRSAVIGAAAGVALAYGIHRLRRNRTSETHYPTDDRGPGGFGSRVSDE